MNSTVICLNIACRTKTAHDDTIEEFYKPEAEEFYKPSKIGNLFMNRFAIDEGANHDILKIYHLQNNLDDFYRGSSEEGLDLTNYMIITYDS